MKEKLEMRKRRMLSKRSGRKWRKIKEEEGKKRKKKRTLSQSTLFFTHDRRAIPSHILTLHLPW